MKAYTDSQLLNQVKKLKSFKGIPSNYWLLSVRSSKPIDDSFNDKAYLFKGEQFIMVMKCTTHTGLYGAKNFAEWDKRGVAVLKSNEWLYDSFTAGLHKGKVDAFIQTAPLPLIRDNNKNNIVGDVGTVEMESNKGINIHPNTYNLASGTSGTLIGKWSTGCTVICDIKKYVEFIKLTKPQRKLTYVIVDEF